MSINSPMMGAVAQTRITDLRREAAMRSLSHRATVGRRGGTHRAWTRHTGATRTIEARRAIGWFLVSVGLRLALHRPGSASAL
jgi:hypothetical protein